MVALPLGAITPTFGNSINGPSSSESPYLVRAQQGIVTKSILTVGDAVNYKADGVTPYRLVGIPDGLGAFDNGDGTFTLLVNHEVAANARHSSGYSARSRVRGFVRFKVDH